LSFIKKGVKLNYKNKDKIMENFFRNINECFKEKPKCEQETKKNKNKEKVDFVVKYEPEMANTIYKTLDFKGAQTEKSINYLYHRTVKKKANNIIMDGFRLKPDDAVRIESGNGIYAVTSLEDSDNPYNKKHYGNYVVKIGYDADQIDWEHGDKVKFMRLAKNGINGNRLYNIKGIGEVAVLHDINKILSLEISRDNGKTWEKSLFCNDQISSKEGNELRQLYRQYLEDLPDGETFTEEGFINFISKSR